jgi:hypothetical protein
MKASRIGLFVVILSIYALILSYGQPAKPESSALFPRGTGRIGRKNRGPGPLPLDRRENR